jgi:hypothetical protein
VSTGQTILLGAIAGFTIYLGLPLGRVRLASLKTRAFLNAASAGILVFLLFEILGHATEPVEHAVEEAAEGKAGWRQFAALGLVYAVGFGVGLLGLLYVGRLWQRRSRPKVISLGPGAMAVTETDLAEPDVQAAALRTGRASPPESACTTSRRAWPSARPPTAASWPWPGSCSAWPPNSSSRSPAADPERVAPLERQRDPARHDGASSRAGARQPGRGPGPSRPDLCGARLWDYPARWNDGSPQAVGVGFGSPVPSSVLPGS